MATAIESKSNNNYDLQELTGFQTTLTTSALEAGKAYMSARYLNEHISLIKIPDWQDKMFTQFETTALNLKHNISIIGKLQQQITSTSNNPAFAFLNQQITSISQVLRQTEENLNNAFDQGVALVQEVVDKKLTRTSEKLQQFRQEPTNDNLEVANSILKMLKDRLVLLSNLSERCKIAFTEDQKHEISVYTMGMQKLMSLIDRDSNEGVAQLFNRVSILCHSETKGSETEIEYLKNELNTHISHLKTSQQNTLDGLIYQAAPMPKGGENWGQIHRFDNFVRFQEAYRQMNVIELETRLKTSNDGTKFNETQIGIFYGILFVAGFGPEKIQNEDDQVTWVKTNINCLMHLIDFAIEETLQVTVD